jgi:hypothetical protein
MRSWVLTIYLQDIGQQTAAARPDQLFKFFAAQTSPRQQRICDQLDSFPVRIKPLLRAYLKPFEESFGFRHAGTEAPCKHGRVFVVQPGLPPSHGERKRHLLSHPTRKANRTL